MAGDFRRIEQDLERFFRSEGIAATAMDGELYLGVVSTHHEVVEVEGVGDVAAVRVPSNPSKQIISLTRLAREIAGALT